MCLSKRNCAEARAREREIESKGDRERESNEQLNNVVSIRLKSQRKH